MRLNEEQDRAVKALEGAVVVTAGAGSGKTRVLTTRFVSAVERATAPGRDAVSDIVAITFTEKAAGELAERIRSDLRAISRPDEARAVDGAWISTIHGFCSRILRRKALEAGLDPRFVVADTVTTGNLKQSAFERVARGAIRRGGSAADLFGAYGFEAIAAAAENVARLLRTRGLTSDALVVERGADIGALRAEILAALEHAHAFFCSCQDGLSSTEKHREESERLLNAVRSLDLKVLPPAGAARELAVLMSSYAATANCGKAIKPVVNDLKAQRDMAASHAMSLLVSDFASELACLIGEYERTYRELKRAQSLMDFDDLQSEALGLLRDHPEVAGEYRDAFRYTMVDEFQDTDALQLEIVELIAGKNLCTVGDERQSIYRFRGADIGVYRAHLKDMAARGGSRIELCRNYRSHEEILGFVNALFGSPELFGENLIRLVAARDGDDERLVDAGPRVRIRAVRKDGVSSDVARLAEAAALASEFANLRDGQGFSAGEMVVLLRSYTHAEVYANALRERGLPAIVLGGSRFFDRPEVELMRALLAVIANPEDDEALAVVCASGMGRMTDEGLWALRGDLMPEKLWTALKAVAPESGPADRAAAERIVGTVEAARASVGKAALSEILLRAVEEFGYDLVLLAQGDVGSQAMANVVKTARLADSFETQGGFGPSEFAAYLDAKQAFRDHEAPAAVLEKDASAVRLMSIHSAKGLEFPVVALAELSSSGQSDRSIVRTGARGDELTMALKVPTDWFDFGDTKAGAQGTPLFLELDEERSEAEREELMRLFYVGCTRAREVLLLTGSLNKDGPTSSAPLAWPWGRLAAEGLPADGEGARVPFGVHEVDVSIIVPETDEPALQEPAESHSSAFEIGAPQRPVVREKLPVPSRLSYSHFAAYKQCPMRFLATYPLGMRERAVAGDGGTDPRQFGSAVHAVLESAGDSAPGVDLIGAVARRFALSEGETEALAAAAGAYAESPWARRVAAAGSARREMPFALRVGEAERAFVLFGNIDVYAEEADGVLIIDYKTGRSGTAEDLHQRYELQARCYALAALRGGAQSVEAAFVRPQVVEEGGSLQAVSYRFAATYAETISSDLLARWDEIAVGTYPPLEKWDDRVCPSCPIAQGICPVRP